MKAVSKKKLVELIVSLAWFVGYMIYAFSSAAPATDNLQGWAVALLISIGISVVLIIIVEIAFHLKETEQDKTINAKANNSVFGFMALGILGCLIALACGASAVVGFHIILGFSCFLGMSVGCVYSIILYEKGVKK